MYVPLKALFYILFPCCWGVKEAIDVPSRALFYIPFPCCWGLERAMDVPSNALFCVSDYCILQIQLYILSVYLSAFRTSIDQLNTRLIHFFSINLSTIYLSIELLNTWLTNLLTCQLVNYWRLFYFLTIVCSRSGPIEMMPIRVSRYCSKKLT